MKTLHKNKKNIVFGITAAVLLIVASLVAVVQPKIYRSLNGEDADSILYNSNLFKAQLVSSIRYMEYQDQAGETDPKKHISKTRLRELLEKNTTIWSRREQEAAADGMELTQEEKKDIEEEIDQYCRYIYEGYQQTAEWITSVPTISFYMINEVDKNVVTNNKKMEKLLTQQCEDTEFNQYDFLVRINLEEGFSCVVHPLKGVDEAFGEEIESAYYDLHLDTMDSDSIKIMSWLTNEFNWKGDGNRTIIMGIKDKDDIACLNREIDPQYKWCTLQWMYVLELIIFSILFMLYRKVLAATITEDNERIHLPIEGTGLAFILLCIVLPILTVTRYLDVYSYRKNWFGGICIYLSLCMIAITAYVAVRIKNSGIKEQLKKESILYKRITPYLVQEKDNKKAITVRLARRAIIRTIVVLIAWYAATYIFRYHSALQTMSYLVSGLLLIIIWTAFYYARKYELKEQGNYQILLAKAEEITSGRIGDYIKEDLGKYNPLRDAINHINEGLSKAVDEAVKSQSMKTELITNVSHDLKTPLTSIVSYVDLLKRRDLTDDEKREYIEILDQKSARLKTLIEDLFEMSKAASRDVKLTCSELNIVALTREVLVEHEPAMDKKDLKVNMSYISDTIKVNLDGQKTYRIISNLIGNITKYAMPRTRVYVSVSKDENDVMLEFKNTSATELTHQGEELAERFVREDQSRNTEGSGLGLAIAKSLTELQQGTFKVEADGDLFKVRITFPLIK